MKSKTISIIVVLVLAVIAIGGYYFPKSVVRFVGGSSAGSTFDTARTAAVVANLATAGANATSSSILNTDTGNRYVTGVKVGCSGIGTSKTAYTGAGLANLTFTIGTSSIATPATFAGFANLATAVNIPTTTAAFVLASSTTGIATSTWATIWPPSTYMTFSTNATNTAVCTFGVDYLGS